MEFATATKSKTKSSTDEWYTPESAVYPIIPYIKRNSIIWCPFDKEDSAYVKVLSSKFKVIATHIDTGSDFFTTNVENYDYIISNPPFSERMRIFERLFKLGKPFAMLFNYAGLWDSQQRFEMFKKCGIELLIIKGRTKFIRPNEEIKTPMFQSIYVCHGMLPEKIIYE